MPVQHTNNREVNIKLNLLYKERKDLRRDLACVQLWGGSGYYTRELKKEIKRKTGEIEDAQAKRMED